MGNSGNIYTAIDFKDTISSSEVMQLFQNRLPPGIYYGADLSISSNTLVSVSIWDVVLTDGTYFIRSYTTGANTVVVSTTNVYVYLTWSYSGLANNVPVLGAGATIPANAICLGKCVYASSTLTGFNLSSRSSAPTFEKFCFVEPTGTASMQVKVRAGNISNGNTTYFLSEQLSSLFSASALTAGQSRIDLVTVNSGGSVVNITGVAATTGSQVAPSSAGNLPLAQITLTYGQTSIVAANILDARPFLNTTPTTAVTITINQTAHGFTAGQLLTLTGTGFAAAIATSNTNATVVGIVSTVLDANDFILTLNGYVTGLSGLTIGTLYYLSGTSAGALTATNPAPTYISLPSFFADSSTSGYFIRNTPVGSLLGQYGGRNPNQIYQATTDGFVFGYAGIVGSIVQTFELLVGATSPPTNIMTVGISTSSTTNLQLPYFCYVNKGWYWEVTNAAAGGVFSGTVIWVPLGS